MNYYFIETFDDNRVDQLMQLYATAWWTTDRIKKDVLQLLLDTTITIGMIDQQNDQLIGFLRCLTDKKYKALVFDVILLPSYHGKGLGKQLINYLLVHPILQGVGHIELYCAYDMESFYEKFGFTAQNTEMKFMRLTP